MPAQDADPLGKVRLGQQFARAQQVGGAAENPWVVERAAADADAGNFNGSRISVALGNVPAGQTRTITFRTVIQ
jgi:hypothetical protein